MKIITNHSLIKNSYGFTLLELMVAISIFAIVSLLTMGGLNNMLNTQEHAEKKLQRLTQFQMVFTIMSRELQQLASRPIRDEYGGFVSAVSDEGVDSLEFTHQGRITLGDDISLQRVAYYLEDKKLIKKVWRVLDRVEDSQPEKQVLLDDINSLTFSLFSSDENNPRLIAVGVSIVSTDFGDIYRLFEVAP